MRLVLYTSGHDIQKFHVHLYITQGAIYIYILCTHLYITQGAIYHVYLFIKQGLYSQSKQENRTVPTNCFDEIV